MGLPLLDREIETVEDLLAVDLDVQVLTSSRSIVFTSTLIRHPEVRGQSQSLEG